MIKIWCCSDCGDLTASTESAPNRCGSGVNFGGRWTMCGSKRFVQIALEANIQQETTMRAFRCNSCLTMYALTEAEAGEIRGDQGGYIPCTRVDCHGRLEALTTAVGLDKTVER